MLGCPYPEKIFDSEYLVTQLIIVWVQGVLFMPENVSDVKLDALKPYAIKKHLYGPKG